MGRILMIEFDDRDTAVFNACINTGEAVCPTEIEKQSICIDADYWNGAEKQKGYVRSIDLARHMGFSKPSISHAVKTLKHGGFLTVSDDGQLDLMNAGLDVAERIYEPHRLLSVGLIKLGVDPICTNFRENIKAAVGRFFAFQ